jgi:hypothetical protein
MAECTVAIHKYSDAITLKIILLAVYTNTEIEFEMIRTDYQWLVDMQKTQYPVANIYLEDSHGNFSLLDQLNNRWLPNMNYQFYQFAKVADYQGKDSIHINQN